MFGDFISVIGILFQLQNPVVQVCDDTTAWAEETGLGADEGIATYSHCNAFPEWEMQWDATEVCK